MDSPRFLRDFREDECDSERTGPGPAWDTSLDRGDFCDVQGARVGSKYESEREQRSRRFYK